MLDWQLHSSEGSFEAELCGYGINPLSHRDPKMGF
jgi:hypothetical protein